MFGLIRNLFALFGFLVLVLGVVVYLSGTEKLRDFDPRAAEVLSSFAKRFIESDMATAAVVRVPVAEGVTLEDAVESMKLRANLRNIKLVGEKPLHQQIEATTGQPHRYAGIFEFCDAATAAKMLDYNPDYIAFMPCRIALFEDADGNRWLETMNMDLLIHGGRELKPQLKESAVAIREGLYDIMQAGANGDL
ncbi:DUF302 domain-containing protein [Endothiovibrio diazotrophicus]